MEAYSMAIEWTERYQIWTARLAWVEIQVLWEGGQWRAWCGDPRIRANLGQGDLKEAQTAALELLIAELKKPIAVYEAARNEP
jgi:hypothetical protein